MSSTYNSDSEEEDYYEDDEDMDWRRNYLARNRYEFCDLPLPEGFSSQKWIATGTFTGDIKWNNSQLNIKWEVLHTSGDTYVASCKIDPFTDNCGIKAVSHIYVASDKLKTFFIEHLENFLKNCLNTGLMIGSDCYCGGYAGVTGDTIKKYGQDYVFTDPVWNPNYTWDKEHKIFLFHKDLTKHDYPDIWKG